MKQVAQVTDTVYVSQIDGIVKGQVISVRHIPKAEDRDEMMAYGIDVGDEQKPLAVNGSHVFKSLVEAKEKSNSILEDFYKDAKVKIENSKG